MRKCEKWFSYGFFVLYFAAFYFAHNMVLSLVLLAASAVVVVVSEKSVPPHPLVEDNYYQRVIVFLVVFVGPAVFGVFYVHQRDQNKTLFREYLAEHHCKFVGNKITGYFSGRCDRFDNCIESEEAEEPEYFCASTRRKITFSDFEEGLYKK